MTVGVDVCKDRLDYCTPDGNPSSVPNSSSGIESLMAILAPGATIAMEATGRYHKPLADTAYHRGLDVIVLNPRDSHRYFESISSRATNDRIAARDIALFANSKQHRLYTPPSPLVATLKELVRRRGSLVKQRVAIENQAREDASIAHFLADATSALKRSISVLDRKIVDAAGSVPQYKLLLGVPGFGPLVAAYMVAMLGSGEFVRSDSFVAFVGLDLKVKDSGKRRGRRCLTKRGDPEARRLLYLAALTAARIDSPFRDIYLRCLDKGLSNTEAAVVVSRKLARVAWAIYTRKTAYNPDRVLSQPGSADSNTAQDEAKTIHSEQSDASVIPTADAPGHSTTYPPSAPNRRRGLDNGT